MKYNEKTKVIPLQNPNETHIINNTKLIMEVTTRYYNDRPFIEWCKIYISLSPTTLQNILDTITDIILDEQIEIVDIPNIVLVIVTNVSLAAKKYDIVSSEHILNLTKIIIHMIIDHELFSVSLSLQNNIVVEAMINSCLELVLINLNNTKPIIVSNKTNLWDWIMSFFT